MATVAFHTLGCKVNSYESEAMLEIFKKRGYDNIDFESPADVYVINTCTVTNTGDSKSRQMIRKAHRTNPDAVICVVGCYSQVASEEITEIEGVSVVLGTQHRASIVDFVEEYKITHKQIVKIENVMKVSRFEDLSIHAFENKTRAFLKIQDGCNNFCTYCIIPYARGGVRSRPKEDVLRQAQELVDRGFVEIVLTGIHTAGYGVDLDNYSFYDLLVDLTTKIKGLKRLRISSIEMSQVSDEIIELIGRSPIIVDHLHIPIQSGTDSILRRMARHYNTAEFEKKYLELKEALPGISITTDVIVGFPGETEEDFVDTYNWIKKLHFNQLHVFPYSRRKGTPADRMPGQVPGGVKKDRVRRLLQLSDELKTEFALSEMNKELEVLIEEEKDGYMVGHASNYLKVLVADDSLKEGHIYKVKVTDHRGYDLIGVVSSEEA